MNYTIQVVELYNGSNGIHALLIKDDDTGQYLSLEEYEEWIQVIGGFEKRKF